MRNISRRSFIAIGATAAASAALFGCSSGGSSTDTESGDSGGAKTTAAGAAMRFVTGGESGTYYALGTIMAQHANDNAGLSITAVSSDGSKANVLEIEDGTAQLGFCQSDVMAYAYTGTNIFDGAPVEAFSVVADLYEEQVQIVTCDQSIKSVADLKGKNVSIGAAGSGVYFNAVDILGTYDITESDITPTYQSFQDSADALKDGKIDAAFIVAGAPTTAITDLSTTKTAYLVEIDSEHAQKLIATSPYYTEAVIPAGTYTGQEGDINTLSVGAVVLAADTCNEDDIYAFVADIYDNLAELEDTNAKFGEFSLEKGASITTVPYHAGAARYFEEQGLTVTTK